MTRRAQIGIVVAFAFLTFVVLTTASRDARSSTEPVRYRGRTAEQWAGKFRHRTRQLLVARERTTRVARAIVRQGYGNDWRERAFLCIHLREGSWRDEGAPYWGGLQMDLDFQRRYGRWALDAFGTADHWPVSVQLSVAIHASLSRGFWPWPNTARECGLL